MVAHQQVLLCGRRSIVSLLDILIVIKEECAERGWSLPPTILFDLIYSSSRKNGHRLGSTMHCKLVHGKCDTNDGCGEVFTSWLCIVKEDSSDLANEFDCAVCLHILEEPILKKSALDWNTVEAAI